jgi:hypothetical protein
VDPALATQLDNDFAQIYPMASKINTDREQLAKRATQAASTASQIADRLNSMQVSREEAGRMISAIVSNSDELAAQGTRTAEQAAMALEALMAAQGRSNQPEARASIDELFRQLDNPSQYNGPRFSAQLKRFSSGAAAGN